MTEDKAIDAELEERELASRLLANFTTYTKEDYEMIATQGGVSVHRRIIDKLEAVERGEIKRLMIFIRPRIGKQLADNTPIITSKGWKDHGDLIVGDKVFNDKGEQIRVLNVSEQSKSEYKITFLNGEEIICHGNHEWVLKKNNSKYYKTFETKELLKDKLFRIRKDNGKKEFIYSLPKIKPLVFNKQDLLVHPYLLGFWLGDGKSADGVICKPKDSLELVKNKLIKLGYSLGNNWKHKAYDLEYVTIYDLITDLRNLDLFQNKHIPDIYKYSSVDDRLELLAGLIDSDGTVDKYGRVGFSNTNIQIIETVKFIINSLGYRYSEYITKAGTKGGRNIVSTKDCYNVMFTPFKSIPTVITNKIIKDRTDTKRSIKIRKIEIIDEEIYGNCIEVEGGIYLAGRQMIPTHNSELTSLRFPNWCIGKNPKRKIVVASYGADLAADFGRNGRELLKSQEYKNVFPGVELSKAKAEGGNRETTAGGGLYTVGVSGALTGKGFDIGIIDDPVKDREEAESAVYQQKVINWYTSTFYTRKQSQNSAIILMMTRWNQRDLAGYLLKEAKNGGDKWDVLTIPAIDEQGNEIVWEGKWDEGYIKDEKANVSKRDWAALYQQDPIGSSSNIFERSNMRFFLMSDFEKEGSFLKKEDFNCGIYVDPAFSSSKSSDDASIVGFGKHKISNCFYGFEYYSDVGAPSKTFRATVAMYDRMEMDGLKPKYICIEDVSLNRDQTKFIKDFKAYLRELDRMDILVITHKPKGKKEDRIKFVLEPVTAINALYLRKDYPDKAVMLKIEDQMMDFPNGKHDDIIDNITMAVTDLQKKKLEDAEKPTSKTFHNKMSGRVQSGMNPNKGAKFGL